MIRHPTSQVRCWDLQRRSYYLRLSQRGASSPQVSWTLQPLYTMGGQNIQKLNFNYTTSVSGWPFSPATSLSRKLPGALHSFTSDGLEPLYYRPYSWKAMSSTLPTLLSTLWHALHYWRRTVTSFLDELKEAADIKYLNSNPFKMCMKCELSPKEPC